MLTETHDLATLEDDGALGRRDETEQGSSERRLPASRFADEPENLTSAQIQRDVVDGLDVPRLAADEPLAKAAADRVVRLEAAD